MTQIQPRVLLLGTRGIPAAHGAERAAGRTPPIRLGWQFDFPGVRDARHEPVAVEEKR